MECATVNKLSYVPNEVMPRVKLEPKYVYRKPTVPFEKGTVYKNSYALPGWMGSDEEDLCGNYIFIKSSDEN